MSGTGTFNPENIAVIQNLAQQEQKYLDSKIPKSPVQTVSEIASPQTYGSQTPSGTVCEIGSPQPHSAQPLPPSNYAAQAGPVPTNLPPNHASELQ
jgi:hypothetical protein